MPSNDERERLRQARDALGIDPSDALWTVLLALQWHLVLYEALPRRIELAAARATRQVVAATDAPRARSNSTSLTPIIWIAAAALTGFAVGFFAARWYH